MATIPRDDRKYPPGSGEYTDALGTRWELFTADVLGKEWYAVVLAPQPNRYNYGPNMAPVTTASVASLKRWIDQRAALAAAADANIAATPKASSGGVWLMMLLIAAVLAKKGR